MRYDFFAWDGGSGSLVHSGEFADDAAALAHVPSFGPDASISVEVQESGYCRIVLGIAEVPTSPAPEYVPSVDSLREAISRRYDELIEAGLPITIAGENLPVTVLGRDVAILSGKAAASALLCALNPPAAALPALHDYLLGDRTPALNHGQLAELAQGYEVTRGALFWAHKRAKDACGAGQAPDPADMAILWPEGM